MARKRLTLEEDLRRLEAVDDYLSKNHPERRFERKDRSYCKEVGYIQTLRKHYGNGLELLGGFQGDMNSVNTIDCDVFECAEALELTTETAPFNDQYDLDDWMYRLNEVCHEALTPREQAILFEYFGINTDHEYDLASISRKFNLSVERVRQIWIKALRKIQSHKFRDRLLPDSDYVEFNLGFDRKKISDSINMIMNGGRDPKVVFKIYLNEEEEVLARKILSSKIRDKKISFIKGESQSDVTCTLEEYLIEDDAEVIRRCKREYWDTLGDLIRFCNKVGRLPRSGRENHLYNFMMSHLDNPKIQELRLKYLNNVRFNNFSEFCKLHHRLPNPDFDNELKLWNWMRSHWDDSEVMEVRYNLADGIIKANIREQIIDNEYRERRLNHLKNKYSSSRPVQFCDLKEFCEKEERLPQYKNIQERSLYSWMIKYKEDPKVKSIIEEYSRSNSVFRKIELFCDIHHRLPRGQQCDERSMMSWMRKHQFEPRVQELFDKYSK